MKSDGSLVRIESDEEKELSGKSAELARLKNELAEHETRLRHLTQKLDSFKEEYDKRIGSRVEILRQLEEQIKSHAILTNSSSTDSEIRRLYRSLAKSIHPDLGGSQEEIEARKSLMIEANRALKEGDFEALKTMHEYINANSTPNGNSLLCTRLEIIRLQISKFRKRIAQISLELARATQTDLYKSMSYHTSCMDSGRDHLAEVAEQLDIEIEDARMRLSRLKQESS